MAVAVEVVEKFAIRDWRSAPVPTPRETMATARRVREAYQLSLAWRVAESCASKRGSIPFDPLQADIRKVAEFYDLQNFRRFGRRVPLGGELAPVLLVRFMSGN